MKRRLGGLIAVCLLAGCAQVGRSIGAPPGRVLVACGRAIDVGVPVVLWSDPGGLNAYHDAAGTTGHFNSRTKGMDPADAEAIDAGGWTLPDLAERIDQVVIHYDAVGDARGCFRLLEKRGLSCHLLIDRDGTVYQTLDLRERAWHAGEANSRSVGIELANVGAHDRPDAPALAAWAGDPDLVRGTVQGRVCWQPPFTDAQYRSLAAVIGGLGRAFPLIEPVAPRDRAGVVTTAYLGPPSDWPAGLLGHLHVSPDKIDPGPAFDWERLFRNLAAP